MATMQDWKDVLAGNSGLDWGDFAFFIPRDGDPVFLNEAFSELPQGDVLISKIQRLLSENLNSSMYVLPDKDNYLSEADIMELVRAYCANVSNYLIATGQPDFLPDIHLENIQIVYSNDEYIGLKRSGEVEIAELQEELGDLFGRKTGQLGKYGYTLKEACLFLTKHPAITRWLLQEVVSFPLDHEPYYQLWKAGGDVFFADDRLLVLCEGGKAKSKRKEAWWARWWKTA